MTRSDKLGMSALGLLLGVSGAAAMGQTVAVSVADLGCGGEFCGKDQRADHILHNPSTGRVTIHFPDDSGYRLLESDFTLHGLAIADGGGGDQYEAGTIRFLFPNGSLGGENGNASDDSLGGGASATYEVFGRIEEVDVTAKGGNYNTTDPVSFGVTKFDVTAPAINANGSTATIRAFVAPVPPAAGGLSSVDRYITGFRVVSQGVGLPNDNFRMVLNPTPTVSTAGEVRVQLDEAGRIRTILHDPTLAVLHDASAEIPEMSDANGLFYFNQDEGPGWGHDLYKSATNTGQLTPNIRFLYDNGDAVEFSQEPVIELYFGGEVMHAIVRDSGDGFTAEPVFTDGTAVPEGFDSSDGAVYAPTTDGTGLKLDCTRRGPIFEFSDFNPGSGYTAVPDFSIEDPGGQGSGADLELQFTEAYTGGPRPMSFKGTGESVLLPGLGWSCQTADFNGDDNADLFWRNGSLNASMIWLLNNGEVEKTATMPPTTSEWRAVAADLDGDGQSEVFWSNTLTGATAVWTVDTSQEASSWITRSQPSTTVPDLSWQLAGSMERYGRPSLIWQNGFNGNIGTWTMTAQNPAALQQSAYLTDAIGQGLVPGGNWRIVGSADLDGDGVAGDLLWKADEYNRIAMWRVANDSFLEGDYLKYNGQEVIIDADLGGIGTYTNAGYVNLVWNDGGGLVNWQMNRGFGLVEQPTPEPTPADEAEQDDDEDKDDEGSGAETEDVPSVPQISGPLTYRVANAWRVNEDGTFSPLGFSYFEGLPETPVPGQGGLGDLGGGIGEIGDLSELLNDLPADDLIGNIGGGIGGIGGGGLTEGGITIPSGVDPCDYICSWNENDPGTWPEEFTSNPNLPPSVVQGIWDLLVDGLLESYGCAPCDGGDPVGAVPGACCLSGNCAVLTEADCQLFSGQGSIWNGAGTDCASVNCP